MRRDGLARSVGLTMVTVLAAAAILYGLLQPAVGWPSETRRVVHPAGFSVVAPVGWEQHVGFVSASPGSADDLRFAPLHVVGNPGSFTVMRLAVPPDGADLLKRGYTHTTFAGRTAWQSTSEQPKLVSHGRTLIFDRDGTWYELSLNRPTGESLDSGVWESYLESFRTEAARTSATLPATLPITPPPS